MAESTVSVQDLARRLEAAERELAARRGRRPGRFARRTHGARRALLPVLGLLVALVPLGLFAANPAFSDLGDAAEVHQPNIVAIGNAGISTGVDDPNSGNPDIRLYNPKDLVTREEMATFLARATGLGGNPPVANAATAQTVPDGSITPAKLSGTGATAGQVLTATGTGVAFQSLPAQVPSGVQNAIVRQSAPTPVPTGPTPTSVNVSCQANERATGGGYVTTFTGGFVLPIEDRPALEAATNRPTGWTVTAISPSGGGGTPPTITVYAVCVPTP